VEEMINEEPSKDFTVHINYGPNGGETKSINLEELSDEKLQELYEVGVQEARYVLRERTGWDPAVTLWNITPADMQWFVDWRRRHPEAGE